MDERCVRGGASPGGICRNGWGALIVSFTSWRRSRPVNLGWEAISPNMPPRKKYHRPHGASEVAHILAPSLSASLPYLDSREQNFCPDSSPAVLPCWAGLRSASCVLRARVHATSATTAPRARACDTSTKKFLLRRRGVGGGGGRRYLTRWAKRGFIYLGTGREGFHTTLGSEGELSRSSSRVRPHTAFTQYRPKGQNSKKIFFLILTYSAYINPVKML